MMRNLFSPTITRLYISEMRKVLPPLLLLCSHGELRPSLCDVTKTTVGFIPLRPTFFFYHSLPKQSKQSANPRYVWCFLQSHTVFQSIYTPGNSSGYEVVGMWDLFKKKKLHNIKVDSKRWNWPFKVAAKKVGGVRPQSKLPPPDLLTPSLRLGLISRRRLPP